MDTPLSRRTLLGVGGTALALSVAGCSALESDPDSGTDETNGDETQRAMFVADIDDGEIQAAQEEAQETQQEAQQQLQEGEIDEEEYEEIIQEAQGSVQQVQRELFSAAIGDLESHAESIGGLTIVESTPESGVALGEGDGDAIVEALALDSVQAVLDESEYDAFSGA